MDSVSESGCSVRVPAGHGRVVEAQAGQIVQVTDVDGGQVGDLFVFMRGDLAEYGSASHTRSMTRRLFPRVGDAIYSTARRPILKLIQDKSPGRHDSLYAACDPERYKSLGVTRPHRSCATNLQECMVAVGGLSVPTPQPFNIFMETAVDESGALSVAPATSKAGDFLQFRALEDVVVAISACPFDCYEISHGGISDLAIDVIAERA